MFSFRIGSLDLTVERLTTLFHFEAGSKSIQHVYTISCKDLITLEWHRNVSLFICL